MYLPDSITNLGSASFESNHLKDIRIGKGIRILQQEVFRGNLLEEVTIPSTVEEIHSYAFSYNYLKKFEIPKSVHTLGIRIVGSKIDVGHVNTLKEIKIPKELKGLLVSEPRVIGLYGYATGSEYSTPELNALTFDESIITYY